MMPRISLEQIATLRDELTDIDSITGQNSPHVSECMDILEDIDPEWEAHQFSRFARDDE